MKNAHYFKSYPPNSTTWRGFLVLDTTVIIKYDFIMVVSNSKLKNAWFLVQKTI